LWLCPISTTAPLAPSVWPGATATALVWRSCTLAVATSQVRLRFLHSEHQLIFAFKARILLPASRLPRDIPRAPRVPTPPILVLQEAINRVSTRFHSQIFSSLISSTRCSKGFLLWHSHRSVPGRRRPVDGLRDVPWVGNTAQEQQRQSCELHRVDTERVAVLRLRLRR
jgi:hypothetical protein